MFLVSYLELQLITHDMNEIVLSVRSVWLHLISGIHLFLRGLSLSLNVYHNLPGKLQNSSSIKKNDNFLISAILKTFFKFHALCHNLVFANASLSLFYHCIIKNNCSELCQTSIKNKPPSANVKTAASHIYLLLFEQTNEILQHFIKFCGIK